MLASKTLEKSISARAQLSLCSLAVWLVTESSTKLGKRNVVTRTFLTRDSVPTSSCDVVLTSHAPRLLTYDFSEIYMVCAFTVGYIQHDHV